MYMSSALRAEPPTRKIWLQRRKQGSCIVCKEKKLVHVCVQPVRFLVCAVCYNKNKGPCIINGKATPKHLWLPTITKADVGDRIQPKRVPKDAWFYCSKCEEYLL